MNGKPDAAIWHFRKALFYDSDNVNARDNLAYALFLQGRLEEAVGQCKQILQRFLTIQRPTAFLAWSS